MPSQDDPGHEIDPAKGWRGLRSTYQERGPSRPGPTTAQSAQLNTPRRERRQYARAVVSDCSRFPLQNAQATPRCMPPPLLVLELVRYLIALDRTLLQVFAAELNLLATDLTKGSLPPLLIDV